MDEVLAKTDKEQENRDHIEIECIVLTELFVKIIFTGSSSTKSHRNDKEFPPELMPENTFINGNLKDVDHGLEYVTSVSPVPVNCRHRVPQCGRRISSPRCLNLT